MSLSLFQRQIDRQNASSAVYDNDRLEHAMHEGAKGGMAKGEW